MQTYDVVIVGSGAGGGIYAMVLAESGANVLLLDAGGRNIDRDIRHHQWQWELPQRDVYQPDEEYTVRLPTSQHIAGQGIQRRDTVFDGSAHGTYYNDHFWAKRRDWKYTFPKEKPYRWVRVRALGGKTNCWDAGAARWGPRDFKPATYDGYDVDWPVDYAEMAPWYTKAEELIGVSGGPETHSEHCPTGKWLPRIAPRCGELRLAQAAQKFGLFSFSSPKGAITRDYKGRPKCHYCGPCNTGCDSGSKFTSIGVLLPPALATGRLTIRMNSIVRGVLTDNNGLARGLSYVDRYTFREGEVYGRVVVLAASAIETARIMLNSKSGRFPDGIANSSGQVGQNLVENVTASVGGYLPELQNRPVLNDDGWGGMGLMIAPFTNVDDASRSKKYFRRYSLTLHSGFGMHAGGSVGGYLFGEDHKHDVRRWYGSGISVAGQGEGIWNRDNRVAIDPDVKDAWGIPAANIRLAFGENEQKMIEDITERGIKLIEAAGGKVTSWSASPSIPGGSIHEQGTCRMGNDPKKFVTNRWGQCHDVKNLIIGDGALHPTCSVGDPTLTIMSVAMRNAENLVQMVRRSELKT